MVTWGAGTKAWRSQVVPEARGQQNTAAHFACRIQFAAGGFASAELPRHSGTTATRRTRETTAVQRDNRHGAASLVVGPGVPCYDHVQLAEAHPTRECCPCDPAQHARAEHCTRAGQVGRTGVTHPRQKGWSSKVLLEILLRQPE